MSALESYIMQGVEFLAQDYPGVVVLLDENRRVVFVGGEAAVSVSGLITAGEYLSSRGSGTVEDRLAEYVNDILNSGAVFSGNFESLIGSGVIVWQAKLFEDSGLIVLKGMVRGVGPRFGADLTELDILHEKERMLSTLLSNLPGMAYRCRNDVEWTMEFVSEGCFELTGFETDALLENRDLSYADLILPQYRAYVWECVQEAIQERQPFEVVYKIHTAGGEEKWVWEKGVDIHEAGKLIALEGFITDVTPLMSAKEALHQNEERYRLMAEKTGQMVYDYDLESGSIVWSGAVQEISGYSGEEFQSVNLSGWEERLHPEDREPVVVELDKCIRDARPFIFVYRFRRKSGRFLYVEDEGNFLNDSSGKPVRMVGVLRNYSEKMKIQELMIQSEKMTTVAGLAAGMAHEINNPLGVISQSAQNIERRISPDIAGNVNAAARLGVSLDSIRAYLEERKVTVMVGSIKEASARAARIIMNMINFSRKSGEVKEFCCLADVVDRVLEMAETDFVSDNEYDFKKIDVVRDISPDLPDLFCFIGELEQVLFNLLRNAAQAMEAGAKDGAVPTIILRGYYDSDYIVVEVEDNGPGMDHYTRKQAFEPFFTTKLHGKGCGLGLSIVYFIVTRNHGGTISIDSEPGKGVKFTMKFPRSPEDLRR